jgi:DNA-binding NtrC family response regulator
MMEDFSMRRKNTALVPEIGIEDYIPVVRPDGKLRTMEEVEEALIDFALIRFKNNRFAAAKALGIGRSTLYMRLHQPSS